MAAIAWAVLLSDSACGGCGMRPAAVLGQWLGLTPVARAASTLPDGLPRVTQGSPESDR